MTARPANEASPSDLELMLYADGELDAERAAAVEAWLEGRAQAAMQARAKLAGLGVVSSVVRTRGREVAAGADGIAAAVMTRIEAGAVETPPAPARPTKRRSYIAGAVAVFAAAAAAGILWSGAWAPSDPVTKGGDPPYPPAQPVAHRSAVPEAAPAGSHTTEPRGVEVSAVDFGAHTGTVYYVPSDTSASSTTAVVWLADDGAEEDDE